MANARQRKRQGNAWNVGSQNETTGNWHGRRMHLWQVDGRVRSDVRTEQCCDEWHMATQRFTSTSAKWIDLVATTFATGVAIYRKAFEGKNGCNSGLSLSRDGDAECIECKQESFPTQNNFCSAYPLGLMRVVFYYQFCIYVIYIWWIRQTHRLDTETNATVSFSCTIKIGRRMHDILIIVI